MKPPKTFLPLGFTLSVLAGLTAWMAPLDGCPQAQESSETAWLWGTVQDGLTGASVPDVVIRAGSRYTYSGLDGTYSLPFEGGETVLEVFARLPDGSWDVLRQRGVQVPERETLYRPITLITDAFLSSCPAREDALGVPWPHPRPGVLEGAPIDLIELWWARREEAQSGTGGLPRAELPDILPDTIRVGRRFASTCADNPIVRIDTVDLQTYAAGVVTAEIGVFRRLTTGEESAHECFKVFSIAALSYALWFWARDPDAEYHLDDTACNQRYIDGPYPEIIVQAVQETAGGVLIQADTAATIDKFEYASSCGRNGTLPEYQQEIVEDDIPDVEACTTGGWCGHNDCAGHQDNPDLPGTDRCLVRGICQWGSAERSIRGDDYLSILDHYQPNLEVRWFDEPPRARLMGFVRAGSIQTGEDIPGARVELDTGEVTFTDNHGLYDIEQVEPGWRTLWVTAQGYQPVERTKEVLPGIDNWASVALEPAEVPADPDEDTPLDWIDEIPAGDLPVDHPPSDGSPTQDDQDMEHQDAADGFPVDRSTPPGAIGRFGVAGAKEVEGCHCGTQYRRTDGPTWSWFVVLSMILALVPRRRR